MNAIMNYFFNQKFKNRAKESCFFWKSGIRIFLESGLCQIYIETSTFLAASIIEIVNQILFVNQKLPKE